MSVIRLSVAGRTIEGRLDDNPTVRELVSRLPMTLAFRDYAGQEKLARLPQPLTTEGASAGSAPQPANIGYYAPDQVLVLYYTSVAHYPGMVHLGRMGAEDAELVRSLPDGSEASITRP